MGVDVLLGLQWGDEGKGKIVDYLAKDYDIVARFQGGPNAGHTIYVNGQKMVLHTIPSGIFHPHLKNLIGNGVVVDPITLQKEIEALKEQNVPVFDRLLISKKAHMILPTHRMLDAASEAAKGKNKIGSTLRGIGPTYMDKTGRNGFRIGDFTSPDFLSKYETLKNKHLTLLGLYPSIEFDLEEEEKGWMESIEFIRSITQTNGEYFVNHALSQGKRILAEGAQGSMLDIDFGTYPFVTSSNTITAGVCNGLGVAPSKIGEVIGITKAYCTRVGAGPFPTELHDEVGEEIRRQGREFGATTGRPRRCGWLDLVQLKYTCMLNGVTQIAITKIDVLNEFESLSVAKSYVVDGKTTEELPYDLNDSDIEPVYTPVKGWLTNTSFMRDKSEMPDTLKKYIMDIERYLNTPIKYISVGPGRDELFLNH
jgi:adenylosuccinate synthase